MFCLSLFFFLAIFQFCGFSIIFCGANFIFDTPSTCSLCLDFQWSNFLYRNRVKTVSVNVFINHMAYVSSKEAQAGTKCRRHGCITCHSAHLADIAVLNIDKLELQGY